MFVFILGYTDQCWDSRYYRFLLLNAEGQMMLVYVAILLTCSRTAWSSLVPRPPPSSLLLAVSPVLHATKKWYGPGSKAKHDPEGQIVHWSMLNVVTDVIVLQPGYVIFCVTSLILLIIFGCTSSFNSLSVHSLYMPVESIRNLL